MEAPNKVTEIKAAVSAVIALGTALFGWVGWIVIVWLAAMVLDYLTGSWAALYKGQWSSALARKGLWHKLGSIAAMLVAALCDIALSVIADNLGIFPAGLRSGCLITPVVAVWYIFTELGSIIENISSMGAPVPAFLVSFIKNAKSAADGKGASQPCGGDKND